MFRCSDVNRTSPSRSPASCGVLIGDLSFVKLVLIVMDADERIALADRGLCEAAPVMGLNRILIVDTHVRVTKMNLYRLRVQLTRTGEIARKVISVAAGFSFNRVVAQLQNGVALIPEQIRDFLPGH